MLARCRLLQAAALCRQKLRGKDTFFLWQVSIISLWSRGAIGRYQGPTGAVTAAAGLQSDGMDSADVSVPG